MIPKTETYLLNHSRKFWKKDIISIEKLNKISKRISSTLMATIISIIIIGLLSILNIKYFEKLYEGRQQMPQLEQVAKFLKNHWIVPLLLFKCNDHYIIWGVFEECNDESIDQGRSYVDKNINISLCFFSRFSTCIGNGGVIHVFVSGSSFSMNLNCSMFYNCTCSERGGAIYFNSRNSYLRMICANSCSCGASYQGHFAFLQASQVNQVDFLSKTNCSHSKSGYYSLYMYTGNEIVDNTNNSMNNANMGSGILIWSTTSFTSSHCTYSNNKVSDSRCIYIISESGTISLLYNNIVHNNSPSLGVVVAEGSGSKKFLYCIFHNNQNSLFCVSSGSLEVSHSFIDHTSSFSTSITVSNSNNNSFTNTITYQFQFFNSLYCNADIPLIDTTPIQTIEKSPLRSFEATIRRTIEETLRLTIERTIEQTIWETQKETIPRTYDDCIFTHQIPIWREISVVFSFAFVYMQ